jgi:predicted alternative tryptophan synthase beta-subunit
MLLFCFSSLFAQEIETPYKNKKVAFSKDTITLDKVSINKSFFKILDTQGNEIDSSYYKVDFQTAKLIFKNDYISQDSLTVRYLKFPEFLTKTYSIYDENRVVPNEAGNLYSVKRDNLKAFKPFDGLNTSGSITRGITV